MSENLTQGGGSAPPDKRIAYYRAYRQKNTEQVRAKGRERERRRRQRLQAERPPKPADSAIVAPAGLRFEVAETELEQHIAAFLKAKGVRSSKTLRNYIQVLGLFAAFVGPETWPVTPDHIDAFMTDATDRKLKDTTRESYFIILKSFFKWLKKRGRTEDNPADLAERPPHSAGLPRVPKKEVLQRFFSRLEKQAGYGHWQDIRDFALWSLAFDTGLRIGEIMALTVNDLTIEKNFRFASVEAEKTHSSRTVHFHQKVAETAERWLAIRETLPLPARLDSLFVSYHKSRWIPMSHQAARQGLARRCRQWGLPHLHPHQFRHAYAVYGLRNGGDLLDIQKQLGHTQIATTSRYLRVDDGGRGERHNKHSPLAGLLGNE